MVEIDLLRQCNKNYYSPAAIVLRPVDMMYCVGNRQCIGDWLFEGAIRNPLFKYVQLQTAVSMEATQSWSRPHNTHTDDVTKDHLALGKFGIYRPTVAQFFPVNIQLTKIDFLTGKSIRKLFLVLSERWV